MKNLRSIATAICLRILIAAPIFAIGCYLISEPMTDLSSFQQVSISMACFLISIIIVAPSIARLLAEPAGALYYSEKDDLQRPPPDYSVPKSLTEKGLFEKAMAAYEKITLQHPEELEPYTAMIDIALLKLGDRERAEAILNRGLALFPDSQDQEELRITFSTGTSHFLRD